MTSGSGTYITEEDIYRQNPLVPEDLPPPPVIFSPRAFHRLGSGYLYGTKSPISAPRWESFYRVAPPCRRCHTSAEFTNWLHELADRHKNCSPHLPYAPDRGNQLPRRSVGRPRSLTETDLARVLSLSKAGLGSRSVTQELQKAGVDVSRPTVQRALAKKGVYANLIKAPEGHILGSQPANAIRSAR